MTDYTHALPKAVVVGTGFGVRVQLPALRAAGFDVAALVGRSTERTARCARESNVPSAFTSLEEAINRTGARAVAIATPPDTHAALTLTALAHGCHVLCEKPMANSAVDAAAMLEAAERAGVTHLIGHQFRWQSDRAVVARALADGLIGTPRFMTLSSYLPLVASPEAKMPDWWFDEASGGGWLGAHGSHLVDQVRAWLGEFASLSAVLPTVSARSGVAEDSYLLRFELANGVQGVLQHTAGAWGPMAAMNRIAGTRGTLWTENGAVYLADVAGVRELPVPEDLLPPAQTPGTRAKSQSHMNIGPYIRLCEVLRAGVEGRPAHSAVPPPTFRDGLACTLVLDAIRQSAAAGGAVVAL